MFKIENREDITVTTIITAVLVVVGTIFAIQYTWRRRWLYYHASKIPGAFSLPLVGSIHLLLTGHRDYYKKAMQILERFPPFFKAWMGVDLFIVTSRPEDIEVLLNTFLNKADVYEYFHEHTRDTVMTVPAPIWKKLRKSFNPTFNPKVVNSFYDTFVKYGKVLAKNLEEYCGKPNDDVMRTVWRCTLDTVFETITDLDPELLEGRYDVINWAIRAETMIIERVYKFWLHLDFIWKLSPTFREARATSEKSRMFAQKVLNVKENLLTKIGADTLDDEYLVNKRFLNYLVQMMKDKELTRGQVLEETMLMTMAASETTAATITYTILLLGLHPEIQEKMYEEVRSILGDSGRDTTLDDINRMDYIGRVIKESMRVFPAIPFIMRAIDKDLPLDSYVLPAGSTLFIPIAYIHRRPDLWPNPTKFDPDRFLPEEVKKRHRCAHIPFSYGQRNCIGLKYGMLSSKLIIAEIIKCYRIKAVNYKSVDEIELEYHILTRPKKGYSVVMERRE